jgi:NADPH2:quinone reductase
MHAFLLDRPSAECTLREATVATPVPQAGEALIAVAAAALNPVDAKLAVSGFPGWTWPHILGVDAAGTVEAVGAGVDPALVGQRVMVHGPLAAPGSFASRMTVAAHALSRVPSSIDDVTAASLPCAALTAWLALSRRLRLSAGQTILVEAAAGGVGGFAIQLAKHLGARVLATASAANHAYVRGLGADAVIDHRTEDVAGRVRELTDGRGVDAVLDSLGGDAARRDLGLLVYGGQMASLLGLPDTTGIDLFASAPSFHVIALGGAWQAGSQAGQRELATLGDEVLALLVAGRIAALPITRIPAQAQALTAALQQQLAGRVRGKLVLDLSASPR